MCKIGLVRGRGRTRVGLAEVRGPYGDKQTCFYHVTHLFVSDFSETGTVRANMHLLSTYSVPGIILSILHVLSHLVYIRTALMVFVFPFCVRKVKRSLFGVQGKRRLSLASSQGFESPSTFCQHRAFLAVNLFYLYSLRIFLHSI